MILWKFTVHCLINLSLYNKYVSWQISFLNPANYCLLWFVNEPLECLNSFFQVLFRITFCLSPFFLKSYLRILYSDVLILLLLMIFQNSSPRRNFFLFGPCMWFFVSLSVHFSYFFRIKIILFTTIFNYANIFLIYTKIADVCYLLYYFLV